MATVLPARDVQLGDGAGVRGGDDVLHLHRLHDQQALARGDLVARRPP